VTIPENSSPDEEKKVKDSRSKACQKIHATRRRSLRPEILMFRASQSDLEAAGKWSIFSSLGFTKKPYKKPYQYIFQRIDFSEDPFPKREAAFFPEWRAASQHLKTFFAFEAAVQSGVTIGFTLDFDWEFEERARREANPKTFIAECIMREARSVLGKRPLLAFALEEAPGRASRLHAHGWIVVGDGISRRKLARLRAALRRAVGDIKGGARRHQCRFELCPDFGWPAYCSKSPEYLARTFRRKFETQEQQAIRDNWLFISGDLKGVTKEIFNKKRTSINNAKLIAKVKADLSHDDMINNALTDAKEGSISAGVALKNSEEPKCRTQTTEAYPVDSGSSICGICVGSDRPWLFLGFSRLMRSQ
jgi:hypothetical protein